MSNRLLGAFLTASAACTVAGVIADSSTLIAVGGGASTIAALEVSRRLWRWAKSLATRPTAPGRRDDWEFRPGYLVALLATALFMALAFVDAGQVVIALWTFPAGLAFLLLAMGRARLDILLRELLYP